jgi:hypothetical protein
MLLLTGTVYEIYWRPEALEYVLASLFRDNVEPDLRYCFQSAPGLRMHGDFEAGRHGVLVLHCRSTMVEQESRPKLNLQNLSVVCVQVLWVQTFSMAPFSATYLSTSAGMSDEYIIPLI